jgi:membrane-associated phospholipid phosphatase
MSGKMKSQLTKINVVLLYRVLLCGALVFILSSCCSQRVTGISQYGVPIKKLNYLCNDLLLSPEFTIAVGCPPTNRDVVLQDAEAVSRASQNAPAGSLERLRAEEQEHLTVAVFDGALGVKFKAASFPITSNLLQNVFDDAWVVAHKAKKLHYRLRPDGTTENSSFPSGHATEASVLGGVLVELSTQHRAQIEKMAKGIEQNRLILKKHYPTDLEAGDKLGSWLLVQFWKSKSFRRDFAASRQELEQN